MDPYRKGFTTGMLCGLGIALLISVFCAYIRGGV